MDNSIISWESLKKQIIENIKEQELQKPSFIIGGIDFFQTDFNKMTFMTILEELQLLSLGESVLSSQSPMTIFLFKQIEGLTH